MAYTIKPTPTIVDPKYGMGQPGKGQPGKGNSGNVQQGEIVSSGLNMVNATNARSTSGIKALAANYEADIKKVLNAIQGSKYTELKSTIRNYWQGADCDYFIQQLDKTTSDLKTQIAGYTSQMTNALNQENMDFRKFQANNKI